MSVGNIAINKDLSEIETNKQNLPWGMDINLVRRPDRFLYIFSVSKRDFTVERPPLFPSVRVQRCAPGERYKLVVKVPDPFTQAVQTENGRMRGEAHDGLRVAIDFINPNNITNDPDWICPDQYAGQIVTGEGCDLSKQGIFLSFSEHPPEKELLKAEERVRQYYDALRRQIDMLPEKEAMKLAESNKDFGMMADYFGLTYPWHKKMAALVACPNCGENIPKGAPWHVSALGPCINDWQRAVKAGIKKKEDVPEEILATWESSSSSGVASRPKPRT